MRVLLVDDDPAGLDIRRLVLERHGFEVATATSVSEARAEFSRWRPDTVVLDLRLPEVEDGLALIREFREARIIVLCGNRADLDGREEASITSSILSKPVRIEELVRQIQSCREEPL